MAGKELEQLVLTDEPEVQQGLVKRQAVGLGIFPALTQIRCLEEPGLLDFPGKGHGTGGDHGSVAPC